MSLPPSLGVVVSRAERGRTGLHSYDGQALMGHSSARWLHCKERMERGNMKTRNKNAAVAVILRGTK
jgi:hypothetical protein